VSRHLWSVAGADLGAVFVPGHVADVVQLVLRTPVGADEPADLGAGGVSYVQRRDRVDGFEGHYFPLPAQGDAATAEADVTDGWQWSGLLMATAVAGPLFAGFGAAASIGLLVTRRVRAYRVQWITLLVSTVLVIATLVVALSPAGQQVSGWLLD